MKERNLVPNLFVTSNILVIGGALMKIINVPGNLYFMLLGTAVLLAFLIVTIKEISNSKSLNEGTKTIWYIALIMATTIAGLFYILSARKNIINQNKITQN